MLFNSLEFLIFLPIVLLALLVTSSQRQWFVLLVASYVFYMAWNPVYVILLLFSTVIDFWASRKMSSIEDKAMRKPYLYLSLLSNLGLLFVFKYLGFFVASGQVLSDFLGLEISFPAVQLVLPMGISFYTFQTMSYSVDVYNGQLKAEKSFGIFALYVCFFPQLVAGPIERAGSLIPQLRKRIVLRAQNIWHGSCHIVWGYFKKVVIADRLALLVNRVYDNPSQFDFFYILLATIFFSFQIYCDFSGYSSIAIGLAKLMGIELMDNFRSPYFSTSLSEFWSRWHISLSTWFRDYLYIPLGGNRVVKWRWYYNLLVTFLVSGLWHGADWTFIVWGGAHGLFLIFENATAGRRNALFDLCACFRVLYGLLVYAFVCLCWVFFRSNSLTSALTILHRCTVVNTGFLKDTAYQIRAGLNDPATLLAPLNLDYGRIYFDLSVGDLVLSFVFIGFLLIVEANQEGISKWIEAGRLELKATILYLGIASIIFFGVFSSQQFIYFQF